jgi:hypothetical protein
MVNQAIVVYRISILRRTLNLLVGFLETLSIVRCTLNFVSMPRYTEPFRRHCMLEIIVFGFEISCKNEYILTYTIKRIQ